MGCCVSSNEPRPFVSVNNQNNPGGNAPVQNRSNNPNSRQ